MTAPYQEIEPASADRKDWDKLALLFDQPKIVLEKKLDGWRFLLHYGNELPRVFLTGRRKSVKTGAFSEKGECAPELAPRVTAFSRKLGYTVLDGEVMPPDGAGFRDIAGIMNVNPEKAYARIKEIGHPRYFAFDLLWFNGRDVRAKPQSWRKQTLQELLMTVWLKHPHTSLVRGFTTDKLARYEKIVRDGGEGVILKDPDAAYGSGWTKAKRFSTLDVVITGFTEAKEGKTGKYKGQIGAALVSVYDGKQLVEVGQVSGMDDVTRMHMTRKPGAYVGKVVEVAAQEMALNRLRHPRFKRMRPEVNARDATMAKMLADLKAASNDVKEEA